MKKFPADAFVPEPGYLEQRISDGSSPGNPLCLIHGISFEFKRFNLEGETIETMLELGSIHLPVKTWKEIEGKVFDFPINPEEGYIDGSVYLFGAHNPADATRLKFGTFSGRFIPCSINLTIDFTIEGNRKYGIVPLELDTLLELSPLRPYSWVQSEFGNDPKRLTKAIQSIVNLGDYLGPVLDEKVITYEPKN